MSGLHCPACGREYDAPEGAVPSYCTACGAKLVSLPPAPSAPAAREALTAQVPRSYGIREIIGAIVSYFACYCYFLQEYSYSSDRFSWPTLIVAAFVIGLTLVLNRDRKPTVESWVWLACFAVSVICFVFGIGRVWEKTQVLLFVHLLAVWWILCRSGTLLEPDRGSFFPSNFLSGFLLFPFGNFFLRIRTIAGGIRQLRRKREKHRINWWLIPAVLLCLILFASAVDLLGRADSGFADLLGDLAALFRFDPHWKAEDFLLRVLFSLPVGCWLYGLIAGSFRADREKLDRRRERVSGFLELIRRISPVFWETAIVLFSVLYLAFFILQGSYLFGAFTGRLPEGFIVAEYARQGFFELCRIMAVNALLLWLATHMSREHSARGTRLRLFCLVLLVESILFAVIALSKLGLYISIYGFTPLRLQSSWLVCVLLAGCVMWIVNLFTGKRLFRWWMLFGAVTLTGLMFV